MEHVVPNALGTFVLTSASWGQAAPPWNRHGRVSNVTFRVPAAGGWLFNLVALACFFGLFVGALVTRRQELVAAFGLPVGLFAFVSTFTHALTRYNAAMTPFVIISVLWLIAVLARKAYLGSRGIEISSGQTPSKLGSGKHLIPSLSPPLGQKRNPTWGLYPRSLKLLFALNENEDLIDKKFDAEGR